ncbi:MAG: hypothetical protein PHU80_11785, partial [Kiritimatiellae bacterium]|nr:hypothetical protein [Kiritimatiellia bacterium]
RYLEGERRELLRKIGASGMTQAAFCRSNGLSGVTFSKWVRSRRGKRRAPGAVGFAEVEIAPAVVRDLAVEPADMRKGFGGLYSLASEKMKEDPCGRLRDYVPIAAI